MGGGHFQEFEEEYMETLYEFHEAEPGVQVRTGELAKRMGVSPASATEMCQRLAEKGYLEYQPYRGVLLTPTGLAEGMRMKRRHRLAEVLLENVLPFDGDVHETACRLEHAIDDDLEVCLTRLLGDPKLDPSGQNIPPAAEHIRNRVDSKIPKIRLMSESSEGDYKVSGILVVPEDKILLGSLGIEIGASISQKSGNWLIGEQIIELDSEISSSIILSKV